jgi:predicted aspartyl protease
MPNFARTLILLVSGAGFLLTPDLAVGLAAGQESSKEKALPPLEEILARHIEWLGGKEALDRIQSITVSGRLEVAGLSGTFESVQQRPNLTRSDYDLGITKGSQGAAPNEAWVMDGSGRIEPMGSTAESQLRREVARAFSANLFGADGSTLSDLGDEERDGTPWRVLHFAYPDGDFQDLFIAPEDGACTWTRERRDTETYWHRLSDWRVVDGVRVAFRSEDLYDNPASNQTVILERAQFNLPAAADRFAPPQGGAKLHHIDGDAGTTDWIPFELFRGAYIYLHGSVNGIATDMLLDSGAGMTVLDRSFATEHGIESGGEVVARGTGGESTASMASGLTIRVGMLELRDLSAAVIDLGGLVPKLGRSMPVIFGKEVFHSLVVDIDYPAQRLRFIEPADYHNEGAGHRLAISPSEDGHKNLDISVEGRAPIAVALDTGSGSALDLFGWYVDESHLLDGRTQVTEGLSGGVGGMVTEKLTSVRSVEIAGYALADVPIGMQWSTTGAFATKRIGGNLGAGILKRFRVIFDYAHDCLWLEPQPGWENAAFERDRAGLDLERKPGALDVLFVAPGSPAAAGGWKVGDRIVAVDGKPVGDVYDESIDRFGRGPEGASIKLRLENGTERTLVLRRHY